MRREWTKDYQEIIGPNGRKSYIYTGKRFELTKDARRVYANRVTPLAALILGLLAASGFLGSPGSRVLYVALPWAGLCFAAAFALFDCARILLTKRALTARDYQSSALRLKKTLIWMLALSALAAACDALFFLVSGRPADEYLPLVLSSCNVLFSVAAYRLEKTVIWNRIASAPSEDSRLV